MICGIYKIVNKVNGKLYIGQSRDVEKRWREHKRRSKTKDSHLYRAMRKDGLDNFAFSVICEVPESALDQYEISYIKYYETTNPEKGYNKKFGGANGRHSKESKLKMSEAKKNMTGETKLKMSEANKGENNPMFGKTPSDETKKKMYECKIKQYLYQGIVYNGLQELVDFLEIKYTILAGRIRRKQIDVTILSQSEQHLPS